MRLTISGLLVLAAFAGCGSDDKDTGTPRDYSGAESARGYSTEAADYMHGILKARADLVERTDALKRALGKPGAPGLVNVGGTITEISTRVSKLKAPSEVKDERLDLDLQQSFLDAAQAVLDLSKATSNFEGDDIRRYTDEFLRARRAVDRYIEDTDELLGTDSFR